MIRKDIDRKTFINIVKNSQGGYIYNANGKLYKLEHVAASDILKNRHLIHHGYKNINVDSIEWLSDLQKYVRKSHLPEGLLIYEHTPVGVIYPCFYDGYKPLTEVSKEPTSVMLKNIKTALLNNIELLDNGVYNCDFAFKNVLYQGDDVKLIDLDGKYIKTEKNSNYNQVYSYFSSDLLKAIFEKYGDIYGHDAAIKALPYLRGLFPSPGEEYTKYGLLDVIDTVERKILK